MQEQDRAKACPFAKHFRCRCGSRRRLGGRSHSLSDVARVASEVEQGPRFISRAGSHSDDPCAGSRSHHRPTPGTGSGSDDHGAASAAGTGSRRPQRAPKRRW
jgi:hypothetical protein